MEFRRFVLKGTNDQQENLKKLISEKELSREDLILILHTMAFRDPSYDTLSK
jgi:hypothetical protein